MPKVLECIEIQTQIAAVQTDIQTVKNEKSRLVCRQENLRDNLASTPDNTTFGDELEKVYNAIVVIDETTIPELETKIQSLVEEKTAKLMKLAVEWKSPETE